MDLISDRIRRFLMVSIPSVPHLEALMLLWRERERAFPAEEIAGRLYIAAGLARKMAEELRLAELVISEDDGATHRIRTDSPELDSLFGELDRTYASHVRAVSELIHSNLGRKATNFANSFYWRKP